jgi:hypothetical protein
MSRDGARHLSFGYGQHLGIGGRLAEIQLRVLLENLLQRHPDFDVAGAVRRMRTNVLDSIKRVSLCYPSLVPDPLQRRQLELPLAASSCSMRCGPALPRHSGIVVFRLRHTRNY